MKYLVLFTDTEFDSVCQAIIHAGEDQLLDIMARNTGVLPYEEYKRLRDSLPSTGEYEAIFIEDEHGDLAIARINKIVEKKEEKKEDGNDKT